MVQLSVKIKNLDQIQYFFRYFPVRMTKELDVAISRIILRVESDAKKLAPVNKQSGGGNLRQSIRSQMTGTASGMVEVGADYAEYVHEGTRPHTIVIKSARVLANKRTNQIFGKKVMHPGTKPNPFLQAAIDKNEEFINDQFDKAIQNVLT